MHVCMYMCMYTNICLESYRRFESDEQRGEVMTQYTEVDSLYVCMYMIALYCMYCICAYLRVQINLKVSL